MPVKIAVLKETRPHERRVALVPESCKKLMQAGYEVSVEAGAGTAAGYTDAAYRDAGVRSRSARQIATQMVPIPYQPPASSTSTTRSWA